MPSDFKAEHFTKAFSGLKWDKAQPRIHFVDFEASLIDGIHLAAPNVKQDIINFLRDGTIFPEIDERPVIADDASDAAWKRYERLEKIWERKKSLLDEFDSTCLFALQAIHEMLPEHLRVHCKGEDGTISSCSLHDCFHILKELFGTPNNSEFNQILAVLHTKMDRSVSLQDHIHSHKRLHQILKSAGQAMAPALQVNILRDSLPDFYTPFLDLFDTRTPEIIDLDFDTFTNSIQVWAENRRHLPGGKVAAISEVDPNPVSHSSDIDAAATRGSTTRRQTTAPEPDLALPTLMSIHSELTSLTNLVNRGLRSRPRSRGQSSRRSDPRGGCPEHPGAKHDASQCWILHPELKPVGFHRARSTPK
jgi:hypothetical protein